MSKSDGANEGLPIQQTMKDDLWDDLNVVVKCNVNGSIHLPTSIIGDAEPLCDVSRSDEIDWQVKPKSVFAGCKDDLCDTCVGRFHQNKLKGPVTDKQFDAVITAYRDGWYDQPKETKLRDVAEKLDIHRSTLHGRVRRAHVSMILLEADRRGVIDWTDEVRYEQL